MEVTKNVVLITGGSSGIGFELAKQLIALGNTVAITGRDPEKLARAQKALPSVLTFQSDVSKLADIEKLFVDVTKALPTLNVLVNNAGIMRTVNVHHTESPESTTREIDVNLNGPIWMTKQFLPHLKAQPHAAIVNVTSGLAFVPLPTSPVYCATKAGLHSFTLSLRVQLKNTNIKVFELAPPATKTELLGGFDPEDMKGITMMEVGPMVENCIQGLRKNQQEIRPGQSNQLKFMSRVAPDFILSQMSKPVDRMLAKN